MAQYETGSRTPKADLTRTLAGFFEVSTDALTVPDIDSDIGLMHTLFALEDIRGLKKRIRSPIAITANSNLCNGGHLEYNSDG